MVTLQKVRRISIICVIKNHSAGRNTVIREEG
nr:MAG TPA: hypothetical protein [Caudoviricetes sp.]